MPEKNFDKANCYGYALGIDFNCEPGSKAASQGVNGSDHPWHAILDSHKTELMEACVRDGLVKGEGGIAVFIHLYASGIDYHFYRRNEKGIWKHKMGNTGTVQEVTDPETHDKSLVGTEDPNGDVIIGQCFCGYLSMPIPLTEQDFED